MLPKLRIWASVLVGVACALMVGAGLQLHWLRAEPLFPSDVSRTTFLLEDATAEFLNPVTQATESGPLRQQLHYQVVQPFDEDTASLRVGYSVVRADTPEAPDVQRALQAGLLTYSFDRGAGTITSDIRVSDQLALPAQDVPVDGYWLKFPMNAGEIDYPVFDVKSRSMISAEYQDSEERDGRLVRHYRQNIAPINLAQQYPGHANSITVPVNPMDPAAGELTADLYHMGTRDWFVDAATGMVINISEDISDYYAVDPMQPVVMALRFQGELSSEDQEALLEQAANIPDGHTAQTAGRIIFLVGLVLFVGSVPAALGWYPQQRRHGR